MALLNMVAELTGAIVGLSPFLAQTHINRAYREILDARIWSFLVTDGYVVCPTQIVTGTVAITQYTATVTADATASAALLDQATGAVLPGLTNLQMRFGASSPAAGSIYNIIDVDVTAPAALVLTLDRVVLEATDATSSYQVYRCYIVPPIPDFKAWESLVDPASGIRIVGDRLNKSSAWFDIKDPQRGSQGQAYFLGRYSNARISDPVTGAVVPNPNVDQGTPIYELWPHPVQGQNWYARFRRSGAELSQPGDVPLVEENLILARALGWHTYPWAMANVAHYPTLKGVNWVQLINASRSHYKDELIDAKRNDNETQLGDVWNQGHGLRVAVGGFKDVPYPIDSNYIQSHLVRF